MTGDRKPKRLGYSFFPPPNWLQAMWESRDLTDESLHLHLALYHRANTGRLADGLPCLKIRLETLAEALHRPINRKGLESLRRFVALERERGRLGYVVEGNAHVGYTYRFTLHPGEPSRSASVPPSAAGAVPTLPDPQRVPACADVPR